MKNLEEIIQEREQQEEFKQERKIRKRKKERDFEM